MIQNEPLYPDDTMANPVTCPRCQQPNNCFIGTFNKMTYVKCLACDIIIMVDPEDHSKIWGYYEKAIQNR